MLLSFMQRRTWTSWFRERFGWTTSDVGLAWRGSPKGPQGPVGLFLFLAAQIVAYRAERAVNKAVPLVGGPAANGS